MSFGCLLSSPHRLSAVSVVFDFSDSLNDVAPVSRMLLPVNVKYMKSGTLLKNTFVCCFVLSSPSRLSAFSVVFDSNPSFNAFSPYFPKSLTIDVK